jgi:hypothetical protein
MLVLTLMLISSSFYTTRLGLSPVYILLPASIYFWVLLGIRDRVRFKLTLSTVLGLAACFYLMALNSLTPNEYTAPIVLNFILAIISLIAIKDIKVNISLVEIGWSVKKYNCFVIALASVDTALKVIYPDQNPALNELEGISFYKYKKSFVFGDSNVLALLLMSVFFTNLAVAENLSITLKKYNFVLITLIILTLSRSAVIATMVGIFGYLLKDKIFVKVFSVAALLSLTLINYSYIIKTLITDGSGGTKVKELSETIKFLSEGDTLNVLFGVGFGYGEVITDMYIHGLFAKAVVEGGLFFLLILLTFLVIIGIQSRKSLILFLPLGLASLSLSFYLLAPFQAALLGLICRVENQNRSQKLWKKR